VPDSTRVAVRVALGIAESVGRTNTGGDSGADTSAHAGADARANTRADTSSDALAAGGGIALAVAAPREGSISMPMSTRASGQCPLANALRQRSRTLAPPWRASGLDWRKGPRRFERWPAGTTSGSPPAGSIAR
jgi:hypothetical protein